MDELEALLGKAILRWFLDLKLLTKNEVKEIVSRIEPAA